MNSDSQNVFVAIIAILFLVGFIFLSGYADIQTIKVKVDYEKVDSTKKKILKDSLNKKLDGTYTYFNNALTGLVGGIVAIGFGQAPLTQQRETNTPIPPLSKSFLSLGSLLLDKRKYRNAIAYNAIEPKDQQNNIKELLGKFYSIGYLLLGVLGIATWIYSGDDLTPSLVKSLATVSFGLMLSIVTAYFRTTS